ncbi:helix-turn-helix domain-containing protein [Serratia fonticola]|uniref:Helix-turn-helix transcriptional regulator n=1 Tax=Serratia fonticola TaxID=47917 RepID=A0AAW3WX13_SERFO|nr:helix-turn-helix transcriptional regulator [Serratia fonticola]MBC3215289.1 helix-turn-helix transcriptional regulator [Serratia fonticola]NYA16205.1 helix-turn-helix transcriptional regulator [Serratia fonticola]NYA35986.1 helix-turn-helix transcriptional regulator [Serratia fonticola]
MITVFDENQYYKLGLKDLLDTYISPDNPFTNTLPGGRKNIVLVSTDNTAPSPRFCIDERFSYNSSDTLYFTIRDKKTRRLGHSCTRESGVIYRNSSNEQTLSLIMQAMHEKQKTKKSSNGNKCYRCFPLALSAQEKNILQLLYNGLSMKTISSILNINRRKLNMCKTKAMRKLNFSTNTELAYWLRNDVFCNLSDLR